MYKGKFREGSSKEDPSAWKTRLRCALNKSPDFQEVQDSNHDLGEPYKLYRIVAEPRERSCDGEGFKGPNLEGSPSSPEERHPLQITDQKRDGHSEAEHLSQQSPMDAAEGPVIMNSRNDPIATEESERGMIISPSSSDFWLHIRLYYYGQLVTEVTTQTAEGCLIASQSSFQWEQGLRSPPVLEEVSFPPLQELVGILSPWIHQVLRKLLQHLDKGVLLWVAPEGVFIKRKCQVRVYWNGPLALHKDQPNKLEKEKTCKVLDTKQFVRELELYMAQKGPEPQYQIQLCFGEEYPKTSGKPYKFITAHVEPVFARERLENAKIKFRQRPGTS